MALKKGMFENYVKEREIPPNLDIKNNATPSKYSYNRVFDEPPSLKQANDSSKDISIESTITPETAQVQQTGYKLGTSLTQAGHKADLELSETQTQGKHEPDTKLDTNQVQNGKPANNSYKDISIESTIIQETAQVQQTGYKLGTRPTQGSYKADLELNANLTDKHQTETELGTNRVQTGYKVGSEQGANRVQTGYKNTIGNQKQGTNRVQSRFKTGDTSGYKQGINRVQTGYDPSTNTALTELTGLQRDIIIYLCAECKKNRSKMTEPLTIEHITTLLNRSYDAVKTSIKRLEKKGCIMRVRFKNGRGGWTQYEISEDIYHEAIQYESGYKLGTNQVQTGYKAGSELGSELGTKASSSSSNLNIKETTTTKLSDEWNFDITPYIRFGFTTTQVKQLASLSVITATEVEQSLIEFSYDLDNNSLPPIKTNKINFLMGLLRSGNSYVSEGYKNEQDTMIAEMARRAEGKRKKLLEDRFLAWESGLSHEDRKSVLLKLPTSLMVLEKTYGFSNQEVRNWYFDYYLRNVGASTNE